MALIVMQLQRGLIVLLKISINIIEFLSSLNQINIPKPPDNGALAFVLRTGFGLDIFLIIGFYAKK
jgi:hypothetical protein